MQTKTEKALSLYRGGQIKEALKIFSSFKIGFTPDDKRTIKIAYEGLSGNDSFYKQIGIDPSLELDKAKKIITQKYAI